MVCEKCQSNMKWFSESSVQGWLCTTCGWNVITTNINKIYEDMTEYCVYINSMNEVNLQNIKLISKIAGVNFVVAKQMLVKGRFCVLKAKAPKVKETIEELNKLKIQFEVSPLFKY